MHGPFSFGNIHISLRIKINLYLLSLFAPFYKAYLSFEFPNSLPLRWLTEKKALL